jgi:anti-sigma B factor antagonist
MNIHVENKNGLCRMLIEGEMTIFTAAELKKELIDNLGNCSDIEIDLSQVSEMDTAGLQLLLLIYKEASLSNKSARLISYSPSVAAVFDLFSMDREEF